MGEKGDFIWLFMKGDREVIPQLANINVNIDSSTIFGSGPFSGSFKHT